MILKLGSNATFGRVPLILPILKGPSLNVMRVGIGPPAPCVIEYIFQSPLILALILAVPLPPAGIVVGDTLIESETGFWPLICVAAIEQKGSKNAMKRKQDLTILFR